MVIYEPGDVIWECHPFTHVIEEKQRLIRCNYCFQKSESLKKCSKCWTLYCGRDCQVKDWKNSHQMECKLKRAPVTETESWTLGDDHFQLIAKLAMIATKYPERFEEPIKTFKGETNMNRVSTTVFKSHPQIEQMMHSVSQSFQMKFKGIDFRLNVSKIKDCVRLAMMKQTRITIFDTSPIGMGVYGGVGDFDHSCSPNCCQIFDGTKLQIKAIKKINTEENRPTLGYIDGRLNLKCVLPPSLPSRQWFERECIKCHSNTCFPTCTEQQLADWTKFVLEFGEGTEVLGYTRCNKCKCTRNPTGALDAGLKFLAHQGDFLPNPHPFRAAILSHLFHIASSLDDDRLKSIAKELNKNFMVIYGKDHTVYREYPHIMIPLAALDELP